jgi:hypothetical protein
LALKQQIHKGHLRVLQQSSNLDDFTGERVIINEFFVGLDSTDIGYSDLDKLHAVLTVTVEEYIKKQQMFLTQTSTMSNEGVLLGNIQFETMADKTPPTVLIMSKGVAYFTSDPPDGQLLNNWVQQAVDNYFAKALANSNPSIQSVSYYSSNPHDAVVQETPPEEETDDSTGTPVTGIKTEEQNADKRNLGAILGGVAAGLVVVVLAAFFVTRRKKKYYIKQKNSAMEHVHEVDDGDDDDESKDTVNESFQSTPPSTPDKSQRTANTLPIELDGNRSLAGSESDFTVNTEAGDSMALKSVGQYPTVRASTESFTNRPVHLRKDMLTSTWAASSGGAGGRGYQEPNESVLKPSHFSASKERDVVFEQANSDDDHHQPEFV